ncbi:MAG: hypothetical protein ACRC3H_09780 [Lachnospiraceae bacterium]
MEEMKNKKTLLTGGSIVLAIAVVMAGLTIFNSSAQASDSSPNPQKANTTTLTTEQDEEETPDSDAEDSDGSVDMSINDTRMRWNGEKWEYSTDGGETWSDTPPDGVSVDEDGNIWHGEGNMEDFDREAFMQDVDDMVNDIMSDVDERYGDVMPEGSEGGSFFTYGDTIARKVDNVWEFSSDEGKTWTNEPPEGIEVSEDGSSLRFGGGEGDINDFDAEEWLEKWRSEYENNSSTKTQGMTL